MEKGLISISYPASKSTIIPCTDYSGPEIRQLQKDGGWKVIGHTSLRGGARHSSEENTIY